MPIDYNKYPPDWKETVSRIKQRSNDKCEVCGLKNHQTVYSVPFFIREKDRYKQRKIWFRSKADALREARDYPNSVKTVKVILTTAHLDHDETNHNVQDDRLMHMCQACHLRYDAEEKYKRACNKYNTLF